jgi:predicted CXXCH cytochrome family protein
MLLTEGSIVLILRCKRGCAPCMCTQCHLEHFYSGPNLLCKDDQLICCTCHQDVDIVLIPDFCILDQCGHNALNANHKKSQGVSLMVLEASSFSDSSSDDTDPFDEELDDDPDDDDDSDDDLERESLLSS